MSLKLKNLLFEFATEDYKSIAASGAAEEDLIAVPQEDYENIKKEIELGQVDDVAIEDFVVRNLIEKNEEKINKFISMNQEKLKIAAESKKINLMKILFESVKTQSRVLKGAVAQNHVSDKITSILNKKGNGNYEGNPNKTGSNTTDIIILRNEEKFSTVEVKNATNFENPIAFFDKTIYEKNNSDKGNVFVNLIKYLFKKNNVVVLSKSNLDTVPLDEIATVPLDEIQSANILLSQANIKIGNNFQQCVKFSQMPDELKNNMGKLTNILEGNILCSHEVHHLVLEENGETVFYFLKPKPEEDELKFIYLKRKVGDNEIFSRLTPKEITITDNNGQNIEMLRTKSLITIAKIGHGKFPRAVGNSGKMKKSCFSINLKQNTTLKSVGPEVGPEVGAEIRAEAFELLANHLTDDYFAVEVGGEIKIITSPNKNSSDNLELGTKKLTANDIVSVQLSPYGETEEGKIRVKLECALNYENFITL